MPGIQVDTEWLTRYSDEVRAAGEDVAEARAGLDAADLEPEAFGELGRRAGAVDSYQRLATLLKDQTHRAAEVLTGAGDELRQVVDFHTGGDDDNARDIARKQEW
ncbi:hypothetical protein A8924_7155 [Saccharopolyspora erythraea NRRL 2338]|uniref:Uncharacterized protein n=2 Tax=Saccharopolyspora erythraea TaxID=1836 RepID=A4FPI5_SACEN|nr:hypothetical protein [Saccharopolyspora erythraea]EQD85804.1 hypothetical protein N599_12685 [Saccharopolyspora erythraea D]PFG99605.1 hypothetical protein A8924_7155 [Saccharopolyspora erythraea NRRL 2338]QRK89495.1 hypothetical protein JQX30_34010 [Saccharopolyspora erythraea]CAM05960.1 hypothetical protein SACE_6796 [Saccharopolyspora erythraea NRRL 2338]